MEERAEKDIRFIFQLLSDVGNVQGRIYNRANEMQPVPEGFAQPCGLPEEVLRSLRENSLRRSMPTLWRVAGSVYLVSILTEQGDLWVLGPLCPNPPTDEELSQTGERLEISQDRLEIPHIRASTIARAASTVTYLLTGTVHPQQRIFDMNTLFADLYIPEWLTHHVASTEENHFPYAREREWLQSLVDGRLSYDDEYLRQKEENPEPYTEGVLAKTPEKQAEYLYVSAIALASRAAIDGGVSPFNARELDETYLQKMSCAKTVGEMKAVFIEAIRSFSTQVRRAKADKSQAGLVARCKVYVDMKMYERISVQSIAEALGVSPNHLSALFKKSEGITLTEFIHQKRLDRSRELLRYSTMSISEISEQLMFSSQSHFCRLFREAFDQTPSEYRKRNGWKKIL